MNMRRIFTKVALLPASPALSVLTHGQAGVCKDPWITQAFHQMNLCAPLGSGTTGESDTTRYGNGHWTSYQDPGEQDCGARNRHSHGAGACEAGRCVAASGADCAAQRYGVEQ